MGMLNILKLVFKNFCSDAKKHSSGMRGSKIPSSDITIGAVGITIKLALFSLQYVRIEAKNLVLTLAPGTADVIMYFITHPLD
jgi:hypothetical protein